MVHLKIVMTSSGQIEKYCMTTAQISMAVVVYNNTQCVW